MKDERFGDRFGKKEEAGIGPLKRALAETMTEELLKEKKFLPVPNWTNLTGRDQTKQEVSKMKRETLESLASLGYSMIISLKNLLEQNLKVNALGVIPMEAVFAHYALQFKLMYEDWARQFDALVPDTEAEGEKRVED